MSQRTLVGILIIIAIICAIIGAIGFSPARGATCLTRPGVSHGSVWWRWRYKDRRGSARCWYPGSRYASRRVHSRPAELRTDASQTRPVPNPEVQSVEVRSARTVRTIIIYPPGRSPNERIERAFDKLLTFPVTVED